MIFLKHLIGEKTYLSENGQKNERESLLRALLWFGYVSVSASLYLFVS